MNAITRWLVTGFMAFVPLAAGVDLTGKVTGVAGGDTIKVLGGVDRIKVWHPVTPWEWQDVRRMVSAVEPPVIARNAPVLGGGTNGATNAI